MCKRTRGRKEQIVGGRRVVSRLVWLKRRALLRNNEKGEMGLMKWGREGGLKNGGRR